MVRSPTSELFEIARLIVCAEIAKIHTIEWTPQLLYDEPLNVGMNSNWSGLFDDNPVISGVTERIVQKLSERPTARRQTSSIPLLPPARGSSAAAAGDPIFSAATTWDLSQPRACQRRRQSFRLAVQLSRGVRLGLSAASAGAGHPRIPPTRQRSERDPQAKSRSSTRSAARRPRKMHDGGLANWAAEHGPSAARPAAAAQRAAVPAEPRSSSAHRQQDRRRRARPHPRSRARHSALQRVPASDRPAAVDQLR